MLRKITENFLFCLLFLSAPTSWAVLITNNSSVGLYIIEERIGSKPPRLAALIPAKSLTVRLEDKNLISSNFELTKQKKEAVYANDISKFFVLLPDAVAYFQKKYGVNILSRPLDLYAKVKEVESMLGTLPINFSAVFSPCDQAHSVVAEGILRLSVPMIPADSPKGWVIWDGGTDNYGFNLLQLKHPLN